MKPGKPVTFYTGDGPADLAMIIQWRQVDFFLEEVHPIQEIPSPILHFAVNFLLHQDTLNTVNSKQDQPLISLAQFAITNTEGEPQPTRSVWLVKPYPVAPFLYIVDHKWVSQETITKNTNPHDGKPTPDLYHGELQYVTYGEPGFFPELEEKISRLTRDTLKQSLKINTRRRRINISS